MRIGIEATKLDSNDGGHHYYPLRLLDHLLGLDSENDYVVFASQPIPELDGQPRCQVVPVPSSTGPLAFLRYYLGFARTVAAHDLDVIHLMGLYGFRGASIPVISTCFDVRHVDAPALRERRFGRLLYRHVMPFLFQSARHIIAISESTRSAMIEHLGIPEEKITTTLLGYDSPDIAEVTRSDGLPDRYFLWVGKISPRKNLDTLLRAYRRYLDRCGAGAASLALIGPRAETPADATFERLVCELGLDADVRHLGRVSSGELAYAYANAFAFVFPSIHEGFGIPIVEAMAHGTPVITSRNAGATSEVAGDAALYHDALDPDELCERMLELTTDEARRAKLGEQGRKQSAGFKWERTARQTLAVYERFARDR